MGDDQGTCGLKEEGAGSDGSRECELENASENEEEETQLPPLADEEPRKSRAFFPLLFPSPFCASPRSLSPCASAPTLRSSSSSSPPCTSFAAVSSLFDSQSHSCSRSSSPSVSSISVSSAPRRYPSSPSACLPRSSLPPPKPGLKQVEGGRVRGDTGAKGEANAGEGTASEENEEAEGSETRVSGENEMEEFGENGGKPVEERAQEQDVQEKEATMRVAEDRTSKRQPGTEVNREKTVNGEDEAGEANARDDKHLCTGRNCHGDALASSSASSGTQGDALDLNAQKDESAKGAVSRSSPSAELSVATHTHASVCSKKRKKTSMCTLIGRKKSRPQPRRLRLRPRFKGKPEKGDEDDAREDGRVNEHEDVRRESEAETQEGLRTGATEKVVMGCGEREREDAARVLDLDLQREGHVEGDRVQEREERKAGETEIDEEDQGEHGIPKCVAEKAAKEDEANAAGKTKGDRVGDLQGAAGDRERDHVMASEDRIQAKDEAGEQQEAGLGNVAPSSEEGPEETPRTTEEEAQMKETEWASEGKQEAGKRGNANQGEHGHEGHAPQENKAGVPGKGLEVRGNEEILETTRVPTDEELAVWLFPKDDAGAESGTLNSCPFEATPQQTLPADPPSACFPLCCASPGEDQPQRLSSFSFPLPEGEEPTLVSVSPSAFGREAQGEQQSVPAAASSPPQSRQEGGSWKAHFLCSLPSSLGDAGRRPVSCPPSSRKGAGPETKTDEEAERECGLPHKGAKRTGDAAGETSSTESRFSYEELTAFVHGLLEKAIESPQVVCKVKQMLQEIEEREKREAVGRGKEQAGGGRKAKGEGERDAGKICADGVGREEQDDGQRDPEAKDGKGRQEEREGAGQKKEEEPADKDERVERQAPEEGEHSAVERRDEEIVQQKEQERRQAKTPGRERTGKKGQGNAHEATRPAAKRREGKKEESKTADLENERQSMERPEDDREPRPRRRVNMQRLEELHRQVFEKQRRNRERAEAIARDEALKLEQEKALLKRRLPPARLRRLGTKTVRDAPILGASGQNRDVDAPASAAARREESAQTQGADDNHLPVGTPLPLQSASHLDASSPPRSLEREAKEDKQTPPQFPGAVRSSSSRRSDEERNGERQKTSSVPSLGVSPELREGQDRWIPREVEADEEKVCVGQIERTAAAPQRSRGPRWGHVERFLDAVDERAACLGSEVGNHASDTVLPMPSGPSAGVISSPLDCPASQADEPKTVRLLRLLEERAFAAAVDVLRGLRSSASGETRGDFADCMQIEGTSWEELGLFSAALTSAKGRVSTAQKTTGRASNNRPERRDDGGRERGTQDGSMRGSKANIRGNREGTRAVEKRGVEAGVGTSKRGSPSSTVQSKTAGLAWEAPGKSQSVKRMLASSAGPSAPSKNSFEEAAAHFLQHACADQLQRRKKGRCRSLAAGGGCERGVNGCRAGDGRPAANEDRGTQGRFESRGDKAGSAVSSSTQANAVEYVDSGSHEGAAFTLSRRPGFPFFDPVALEPFSFERIESIMEKITEMEELTGLRSREGLRDLMDPVHCM
ncbi:conserved hypothetical protein [Neospora caninum Liverpool]|uniref:Uncharacterized protein n=1 Tax=Neospora caninum (strain Liverpool) TaxID=572307 RepID=F0V811_NEOCL|nr:conserved hypothetical protein [Neospora caninum Liverpool]CBZ49852.1 conserved hypothetical protein [Neospora caninum Liverpool]|eukprot:XP_003879887.1 conserved hypothetical protein [Neospora caninum Liverpool]